MIATSTVIEKFAAYNFKGFHTSNLVTLRTESSPEMIPDKSPKLSIAAPDGSGKPTNFPQFLNLPPELRYLIWLFALPGPRITQVNFGEWRNEKSSFQTRYGLRSRVNPSVRKGSFYSPGITVPVLLHVNREARQQTLSRYQLLTFKSFYKCRPLNIYANLEIDCVCIAGLPYGHFYMNERYKFDVLCWLKDPLDQDPKRVSMSWHLWIRLAIEGIVAKLSGAELLIILHEKDINKDFGHLEFVNPVEAHMNAGKLVQEKFEDVNTHLVLEVVRDINEAVATVGIEGFEMPDIQLVFLEGKGKTGASRAG